MREVAIKATPPELIKILDEMGEAFGRQSKDDSIKKYLDTLPQDEEYEFRFTFPE